MYPLGCALQALVSANHTRVTLALFALLDSCALECKGLGLSGNDLGSTVVAHLLLVDALHLASGKQR